jgi:hypothetical protein
MRRLLVSALIYQIHYNTQYGDGGNASADLIANAKGQEGNFLKVSVVPEKKIFTVSIGMKQRKKSFSIQCDDLKGGYADHICQTHPHEIPARPCHVDGGLSDGLCQADGQSLQPPPGHCRRQPLRY